MDRIETYIQLMGKFLNLPGHAEFKALFPTFHVTVVCDKLALSGVHRSAFDGHKNAGTLTHLTWTTFLLRTRKMHESFLKGKPRQRKNAAKKKS